MKWQSQRRFKEKIPIRRAFFWIFFSVIAISGTVAFLLFYSLYLQEKKQMNPMFTIKTLQLKSLHPSSMDADFFAEVLGLSHDRPVNLYRINSKEATDVLVRQPVVKSAHVDKMPPSSLSITYENRKPFVLLGDYVACALDSDGVIFPIASHYNIEGIPVIYLGETVEPLWGGSISSTKWRAAKEIVHEMQEIGKEILTVDVSRLNHPSYGQREVVVTLLENKREQKFLRLHAEKYLDGIQQYAFLTRMLSSEPASKQIIDLRIAHLAYIKDEK